MELIDLQHITTGETIQVGPNTAVRILTRNSTEYAVLTPEQGLKAQNDNKTHASQPDLSSIAQDIVDSAG